MNANDRKLFHVKQSNSVLSEILARERAFITGYKLPEVENARISKIEVKRAVVVAEKKLVDEEVEEEPTIEYFERVLGFKFSSL